MLGIRCRLHDYETADDLGLVHLPPPVRVGDLAATENGVYRVVDVVENTPGSYVGALCKVRATKVAFVSI